MTTYVLLSFPDDEDADIFTADMDAGSDDELVAAHLCPQLDLAHVELKWRDLDGSGRA